MPIINQTSAFAQFTQRVMAAISERKKPTYVFQRYFKDEVSDAMEISLEKRREGRPIAVDIAVWEDGKITRRDKSTQHVYRPPFYDYAAHVDAFDSFTRVFGQSPKVNTVDLRALVNDVQRDVSANLDRLERTEELMRAQALLDGIVTMRNGDNVDFRRKAGSQIPYSAGIDWSDDNNHPGDVLVQMAQFIATEGSVNVGEPLDVYVGHNAINAFRDNAKIQAEGDLKDMHFLTQIIGATDAAGRTPQGAYSRGNYRFNFWGYEGTYDTEAQNNNYYMDPDSILMLPMNAKHTMFYGGTKSWVGNQETGFPTVIAAKRNFYEHNDMKKVAKLFGVRTAPLPVLEEIDNLATATVLNGA